ncbi:bifunctional demethylmenaquinone methyltransferase/2-methoxy-6-polyprenyl-1,4-benzoquinol methylase UbiE [Humidisolicoccus flavus]|uniref:bifunctional demethylmenaquinone methyltransferase/2-methoxy-6-polyprenyl-1,4-benzoquinol methylase UbiE n=1 Tax=Humidisolicoccus flavus TaxID=3111414 RepID=UPI00324DB1F9
MSKAGMDKEPEEIAGMFDQTASRYDIANSVLAVGNDRLWRLQMTRAVNPLPGERILDVAAGTGASGAPMAKAGAFVTALDFSAGMIEVGKQRHPELEFIEGSAEDLPFESGSFDAVTISFGLRNVQDPHLALSEFFRVLKPGGRVHICEFSKPPIALIRSGSSAYIKKFMPHIAKLITKNPEAYEYLVDSIEEWPDQQSLSKWLRTAGFTRVAHRNLTFGVVALHRGRKPTEQTMQMEQVSFDEETKQTGN